MSNKLSYVLLIALLGASSLAAEEVTLCAAASLTDALSEISRAYEKSTGNKVVLNLGASNDLARQIQAGAPADVFFSADVAQMDVLEKAGFIKAGDRVDALSNVLVVVVPNEAKKPPRTVGDLESIKHLALADPQAVPAGVYAKKYLESKGLWEKVQDNVVPALNVRAALAAVESENADAGIVYRTDAALSKRAKIAFVVPREEGPRVIYVMAPLAGAKSAAARGLAGYLVSADARKVYERYGFIVTVGAAR